MPDTSMLADNGPSYSLFVEVVLAVGTTVLAMFFCRSKRRSDLQIEGESEEANVSKVTTKNEGNDDETYPTESPTKLSKFSQPVNSDTVKAGTKGHHSQADSDIAVTSAKNLSVEEKHYDSKFTQTDMPPTEERILWKAVIVNALENARPRYRTELYVYINGKISHSESLQKEGIAGVGTQQILAKVQ